MTPTSLSNFLEQNEHQEEFAFQQEKQCPLTSISNEKSLEAKLGFQFKAESTQDRYNAEFRHFNPIISDIFAFVNVIVNNLNIAFDIAITKRVIVQYINR